MSISRKRGRGKRMSFYPVPTSIVRGIEVSGRATELEAWLIIWGYVSNEEGPSIRALASELGWGRFKTSKMLDMVVVSYEIWRQNNSKNTTSHPPASYQPPTSHPEPVTTCNMEESPATHQPATSHPPAKEENDTIYKEIKDINYNSSSEKSEEKKYPLPLGNGLNKSWITARVLSVWSAWYEHNPKAKVIRRIDIQTIRSAINMGWTPEQLRLVISYAFTAPSGCPKIDWWRQGKYININNLLNRRVIEDNVEFAEKWSRGELRQAPSMHRNNTTLPDTLPTNNNGNRSEPQYDEDGFLLLPRS
jgi:hypothetical protein